MRRVVFFSMLCFFLPGYVGSATAVDLNFTEACSPARYDSSYYRCETLCWFYGVNFRNADYFGDGRNLITGPDESIIGRVSVVTLTAPDGQVERGSVIQLLSITSCLVPGNYADKYYGVANLPPLPSSSGSCSAQFITDCDEDGIA